MRSGIRSANRKNRCSRDLEVIKKHCKFCDHHKMFKNLVGGLKCTRCKRWN